jgi:uncharacterized membrane-anchored protein
MQHAQPRESSLAGSKVPAVTLLFWVMKILATTLGETGGDALSMSMGLGYLLSTAILGLIFIAAVTVQIRVRRFEPWLYWSTIVATTTVGTTLADFADRSLGIGYAGGTALLLTLLAGSLWWWRRTLGSIAVSSIASPRAEIFYWVTILFSQTLGTALGDWAADSAGLGYLVSALIFSGALLLLVLAFVFTRVSRTALFWSAFVLTRPLGAVVGDFLDKPVANGGLALDRLSASGVLLLLLAACIVLFRQQAAQAQAPRHTGLPD